MSRPMIAGLLATALGVVGCSPGSRGAAGVKVAALPQPTAAGLARLGALPKPYRDADPAAGRLMFGLCVDCHGLEKHSVQTSGPDLAGIYGAQAASRTSYPYSPALKAAGITWDAPHLDRWIFNPHEMMPATRMSFIGIRNDRKRRDVIAYLIAVSDEPRSAGTP